MITAMNKFNTQTRHMHDIIVDFASHARADLWPNG